jgi:GT2 family glycosyltransferase
MPIIITRIAILITCYNRKEKTLRCLRTLYSQTLPSGIKIFVHLVDDGSSDGTSGAVAEEFPQVKIIQGNGTLYWCGGMRLAWSEAFKNDYDAYLWLNDDVVLKPNAILSLIMTWSNIYKETQRDIIVVGNCEDLHTRKRLYGGYPQNVSKGVLPESNYPQRCYTMNGNLVLIPRYIANSVGNLSSHYTHAMGDIDYGLRATEKGFLIYVAPGMLGVCEKNPGPLWMRSDVPLLVRWKNLHSPKGLPPWEYMLFRRRCGVRLWFLIPLKLYLQVCFPQIWEKRRIY